MYKVHWLPTINWQILLDIKSISTICSKLEFHNKNQSFWNIHDQRTPKNFQYYITVGNKFYQKQYRYLVQISQHCVIYQQTGNILRCSHEQQQFYGELQLNRWPKKKLRSKYEFQRWIDSSTMDGQKMARKGHQTWPEGS